MKTPEQLADEYTYEWWGHYREDNMTLCTRQAFLAGYRAAVEKSTEYNEIALKQEQERLIDRLRSKE